MDMVTEQDASSRAADLNLPFSPTPTTPSSVTTLDMTLLNNNPQSQEIQDLIQGPGDVEWRCVSATPSDALFALVLTRCSPCTDTT